MRVYRFYIGKLCVWQTQHQLLNQRGLAQDPGFVQVDRLPFYTRKVVYQGTEGAYSQLAMKAYFGEDTESFDPAGHVQS
mgnify:CR=1 FL=1